MAAWYLTGQRVEIESKSVQADDVVTVYRRRVVVKEYRRETATGFSFADETQIYGGENLTRVTEHSYETDPITGATFEHKTVVKPNVSNSQVSFNVGLRARLYLF
mgnify:CR=1 FL=1